MSKIPPSFRRSLRQSRGFTLVEMLLVLVILAVLAAIVIPRFAGRTEQAKVTAASQQISSISLALDAFEVDNGYYPPTLDELTTPRGNSPSWKGPYLPKAVPPDPWGNGYLYAFPGKNNPAGYDLSSGGPPGKDEPITNWDAKR